MAENLENRSVEGKTPAQKLMELLGPDYNGKIVGSIIKFMPDKNLEEAILRLENRLKEVGNNPTKRTMAARAWYNETDPQI